MDGFIRELHLACGCGETWLLTISQMALIHTSTHYYLSGAAYYLKTPFPADP